MARSLAVHREGGILDWDMQDRCESPGNLMGIYSPNKGSGHDTLGFSDSDRWDEDFLSPGEGHLFLMFQ